MPKPKTVQTAFRFPRDLLTKVDRFARELERDHPLELTKPVTRAEAVRVLILRGLEFSKRDAKGARP
jgi:hypothetical protein